MFAEFPLSRTSASERRHGGARHGDLSVMTLRASVAACPALACSLLVTASPCVIGWHIFSASVWFFTHKHILLFLAADIPAHQTICKRVIYTSHLPTFLYAFPTIPFGFTGRECCALTLKSWIPVGTIMVAFSLLMFSIDSGIQEPHFSPPCLLCPPPSPAHEFCEHRGTLCLTAVVVSLLQEARPSETFSFTYSLQHVSRTAAPVNPKRPVGSKKANPRCLVLSAAFASFSYPRTSFMATSVFTGLTASRSNSRTKKNKFHFLASPRPT